MAAGIGAWRLQLRSSLDFEVLSYVRTRTVSSPACTISSPQNRTAIGAGLQPGQQSQSIEQVAGRQCRFAAADVSITGIDDDGESPGEVVKVSIPSGAARLLTAAQLENGDSGLRGALGDGEGKWRLLVNSEQPVVVMNLLESPTGHLTNLSTRLVRQ